MYIGNVVKWKHSNELYIVVNANTTIEKNKRKLHSITMIPIDSSNCSVGVSRAHPITSRVCELSVKGCKEFDCDQECDNCHQFKEVPNPLYDIDNIIYVADNIKELIIKNLTEVAFKGI